MKKVFITGSSGFVGAYLRKELVENGYEVIGTDLRSGDAEYMLDVTDKDAVIKLVKEVSPDYIIHLAGFSSVKESFNRPELCFKINVEGTRNILDAIVSAEINTRVLIISSADTYKISTSPIKEDYFQEANSPYGKSRLAQEELVKTYTNVDWVISRSFPHIGPGQQLGFVTSDFASQITEIVKNKLKPLIKVGFLDGIRDFTDVRDTVVAYRLLMEKGTKHEVYNVCSGEPISIKEMLNTLIDFSGVKIQVETDTDKFRPTDIKYNVGDNLKLLNAVGWARKYKLSDTLKDIYNYWMNK